MLAAHGDPHDLPVLPGHLVDDEQGELDGVHVAGGERHRGAQQGHERWACMEFILDLTSNFVSRQMK